MNAMPAVRDREEGAVRNPAAPLFRGRKGSQLVILCVDDQHRDLDFFQVIVLKVPGLGSVDDAGIEQDPLFPVRNGQDRPDGIAVHSHQRLEKRTEQPHAEIVAYDGRRAADPGLPVRILFIGITGTVEDQAFAPLRMGKGHPDGDSAAGAGSEHVPSPGCSRKLHK